jgi:hypothetical protein
MFKRLRNAFNAVTGRRALKPQGEEAVEKLGHRNYVGGMWEEIGKLQFDFLVQQGLKPSHCFLDIGCGSFRGGFISSITWTPAITWGSTKRKRLWTSASRKSWEITCMRRRSPNSLCQTILHSSAFLKSRNFRWRNPCLRI